MPLFKYKTKNTEGIETESTVEAKDRFAVYSEVREEGSTIISVEEVGGRGSLQSLFSFSRLNSIIGTVKTSEKIVFTRNLAAMVDAGLALSRALSVMERQTRNPVLKRTIGDVNESIKHGSTLNESLAKHPKIFSTLFVSMVRAGEEGGSLADSLRMLGEQMDRTYQLARKIKGALIYPAVVIVAMIIIGVLMLMFVVPTLTTTFEELGVELPTSTQFIISVSDVLKHNTILVLVALISLVAVIIYLSKTKRGARFFDFVFLRIPLIGGLVRQTNAARTARTLSALLSSGVEVVSALGITRDVVQNSYFKEIIAKAEEEIQKGSPISKVFLESEKFYPILFSEIISVGEETGKLSEMLSQTADFYEGEVSQKTKDMSTVIEPILMLVVGAGVGFFAISMISPIYSLQTGI